MTKCVTLLIIDQLVIFESNDKPVLKAEMRISSG